MSSSLSLIQQWIQDSCHKVRIIERINDKNKCEELLGISEHSVLGTIINYCGGIDISNGLIRHFGGENQYNLSVREVNNVVSRMPEMTRKQLIIADDCYGGIFTINADKELGDLGDVLYLPPDSYNIENLHLSHSQLVEWSMNGDLNLFFKTVSQKAKAIECSFDETCSFIPPLWVKSNHYSPKIIKSVESHNIRIQMLEVL